MLKAAIVKDDFIVVQELEPIYSGDITVNCNAISKVFIASTPEAIEGGTLYMTDCPTLMAASMIIAAKLERVVHMNEPLTSDEMCAIELLKENGITVNCNPNIIL